MGPLSQTQTPNSNAGLKTQKPKVKLAQSHLNFTPASVPQQTNVPRAAAVSILTTDQNKNQDHDYDHDHDHDHEQANGQEGLREGTVPKQRGARNGDRSWSDVVNKSEHFVSNVPVMAHKPDIAPVFLNFKWVSREGFKIPLIEVAAAVGKVVRDTNVDGVQLIRSS